MHYYATILLSLMAVTGGLARVSERQSAAADNRITVFLQRVRTESGSVTQFQEGKRQVEQRDNQLSDLVILSVGANVKQQDLRCQLKDDKGKPITVVRGANIDTTFGDGQGGPWNIQAGEVKVSAIICDPKFKKAVAPAAAAIEQGQDLDIRVVLTSADSSNTADEFPFTAAGLEREEQLPGRTVYSTVALEIGADVQMQDLRCQLIDPNGDGVMLLRGGNEDISFGDGGKGAWKFVTPAATEVRKIVCSPDFVAATSI
jgi:hypothetical protein